MRPPGRSTGEPSGGLWTRSLIFKELGITTLELLPPVEFQEVMMPENVEGNPYGTQ